MLFRQKYVVQKTYVIQEKAYCLAKYSVQEKFMTTYILPYAFPL